MNGTVKRFSLRQLSRQSGELNCSRVRSVARGFQSCAVLLTLDLAEEIEATIHPSTKQTVRREETSRHTTKYHQLSHNNPYFFSFRSIRIQTLFYYCFLLQPFHSSSSFIAHFRPVAKREERPTNQPSSVGRDRFSSSLQHAKHSHYPRIDLFALPFSIITIIPSASKYGDAFRIFLFRRRQSFIPSFTSKYSSFIPSRTV